MDTIKRVINGCEYTIILSNSAFGALSQLQGDEDDPRRCADGYNRLISQVTRHLTDNYSPEDAQKMLSWIKDLNQFGEIIDNLVTVDK